MSHNPTQDYQPVAPIDWSNLLQSLADSIENFKADHPQTEEIDVKSRAGRIRNYILDLEYCLKNANSAINYYEKLTQNYDRLVTVMEESRNQAYEEIGRLKNEIDIYKKYRPLIYAAEAAREA